jgi:diguanylate cyclase (GGDEF)-like protein/putative nucleotidyltransferase with HDIG domain
MLAVVVPAFLAGAVIYIAAVYSFLTSSPSHQTVIAAVLLLAATTLAERYPVPVEGVDASGVSLGFVFGVAAIALFGWDVGVLVFATPQAIMQLWEHRPGIRIAFNASVFAIAAAAGGALVAPIDGDSPGGILLRVVVAAFVQYWVNMVLVTGVIAANARRPYLPLVRSNVGWTIVPFTLMASASLMLAVLWQRTPFLSAALVGPLIAIALYQRSTHKVLRAMRLALTDPLTGLGNHRHFHDRLARELQDAADNDEPLTLCFVDIDDFKRINDSFGHPTGDRVLSQVATRLRQDGEAFRLGGDEFAIVFAGRDERDAVEAAGAIVSRMASMEIEHVGSITISAGIATFPFHAAELDELIRLTDSALYWAKEHGKNRVHVSRADVIELAELKRLAGGSDRAARFRAASSLARAVDARDVYTGSHSSRVAELAAKIAERLGLPGEEIELTRLAGSLHDLGKLAIPEEILRKPGPLTDAERLVLERHPQIGYRMLESLGVDPVANWVLHHHERWDGSGYPEGLPGDRIPLGARIIFVADAYDAMTSDRVYQSRLSDEEALEELERCAGSQFDPSVVEAFAVELGLTAVAS